MRILVLAALAVALPAPLPLRASGTGSTAPGQRARSRSTTRSRSPGANNPVYLSQANGSPHRRRRRAPARGRAASLRRRELRHAATSRAASRCSTACRSATAPTPSSRAMAWTSNYRVNSATFVNPKAARRQPRRRRRGHHRRAEQLRAAVTQQYLSVLQAQARVGAAGHAREDRAERSSSSRKAKVGRRLRHVARHPPRRGGARPGAGRAAHGAQQRGSREASPLPADGRARSRRTWCSTTRVPDRPADVLARLAARRCARRQNPAIVALRSRERAADLNVKVAQGGVHADAQPQHGLGWQLLSVHRTPTIS